MWTKGQTVGAPADGTLSLLTGAVERATTVIGCDSSISLKISNIGSKKNFKISSITGFLLGKNP